MPRGIAWDELPNHFVKNGDANEAVKAVEPEAPAEPIQLRKIDPVEDSLAVGRRVAFGVIVSVNIRTGFHLLTGSFFIRVEESLELVSGL
jgi:hypothetical protein